MRRTKIVATIGPASRDPETLRALVAQGVDVVRLNFAHGEPAEHAEVVTHARAAASDSNRVVGILADLPGPKMRTGEFVGDSALLVSGAPFALVADEVTGDERQASTTVDDLAALVSEDDEIFLADGEVVLRVQEVRGADVITEVVRGGTVRSRKGLHLPSAEARLEAFTPRDRKALDAALAMEVDLVGLSFIRDERDLERARAALPEASIRPRLVAKIETASAVENLVGIVKTADAVMIARGDLGIQTPLERVPLLQKEIIRACNVAGKPVITATEMLESMTEELLPTRAEVTDVANAIFDGTDAVMLSEETAVGVHPLEAVRTMVKVARSAESRPRDQHVHPAPEPHASAGGDARRDDLVAWGVAHAAVAAAEDLNAAAIVSLTRAGSTPRRVAAYRPIVPIAALSARDDCLGALALSWGVKPLRSELEADEGAAISDWAARAAGFVRERGLVETGDLVVVVGGGPEPRAGATDYLRVVRV